MTFATFFLIAASLFPDSGETDAAWRFLSVAEQPHIGDVLSSIQKSNLTPDEYKFISMSDLQGLRRMAVARFPVGSEREAALAALNDMRVNAVNWTWRSGYTFTQEEVDWQRSKIRAWQFWLAWIDRKLVPGYFSPDDYLATFMSLQDAVLPFVTDAFKRPGYDFAMKSLDVWEQAIRLSVLPVMDVSSAGFYMGFRGFSESLVLAAFFAVFGIPLRPFARGIFFGCLLGFSAVAALWYSGGIPARYSDHVFVLYAAASLLFFVFALSRKFTFLTPWLIGFLISFRVFFEISASIPSGNDQGLDIQYLVSTISSAAIVLASACICYVFFRHASRRVLCAVVMVALCWAGLSFLGVALYSAQGRGFLPVSPLPNFITWPPWVVVFTGFSPTVIGVLVPGVALALASFFAMGSRFFPSFFSAFQQSRLSQRT